MRMRNGSELLKRIRTLDKNEIEAKVKDRRCMKSRKTTMQLWIYRVKKLTRFEKRCMINTPTKRYIQLSCVYTIAVTLAMRSHLFSYRTQKLSSSAPTILDWRRSGKIGRCCIQNKRFNQMVGPFCFGATTVPWDRNHYVIGPGRNHQLL